MAVRAVLVMVGGRFKKEVVLDGQSYLLLIRDEGGLPEMQVLLVLCYYYMCHGGYAFASVCLSVYLMDCLSLEIILLDRVALYRTIAACCYRPFPLTICGSVCPVDCGKMPEWIRMPCGMVGQASPGMMQVVGFADRSMGRSNFGGKYGVPHCNQWRICGVAVRKCVNCRFGVVHRPMVGRGITVVYGGPRRATGRGGFCGFSPFFTQTLLLGLFLELDWPGCQPAALA